MGDKRGAAVAWLGGAVLIVLAAATFAGCGGSAAHLRGYTYPPDFRYISPSELSGAMGQLAVGVERLDRLLRHGGVGGEALQAEVVQELGDLAHIAAGLSAGGMGTNHPWLNNNLGAFRRDLDLARRGATHDPPNYYLAGSIAGACGYCHQRPE
jgi:hypothetical protein